MWVLILLASLPSDPPDMPEEARLRPALVVRRWGTDPEKSAVNVVAFVDGSNDIDRFHATPAFQGQPFPKAGGPIWLTSVVPGKHEGQFRLPEARGAVLDLDKLIGDHLAPRDSEVDKLLARIKALEKAKAPDPAVIAKLVAEALAAERAKAPPATS